MNQAQIEQSLAAYFADFTHPIISGALRFHVKLDETANRWHIAINFDLLRGHEVSVSESFTPHALYNFLETSLEGMKTRVLKAIDYEINGNA